MSTLIKTIMIAFTMLAVVSGCGTTPNSNYYLLNSSAAQAPIGSSPSLGIGPITIPEYLNRNAFIYTLDGNKLHIAKFERWAEPLDTGIMRIIQLNLASLLNTQNVQSYPWSGKKRPEYGIEVSVLILDANDTQAKLTAEWHIYRPESNETVIRRISELKQTMAEGSIVATDIEPAYSKLFFQLSEVIATAITEDIKMSHTGP
ncbi:MAG: membrane integrity-associated transporter subunit PqiC [Methylophaga sp.]|nr:membrane integrity-associated transporter subunit PqiC [Methylophaga sp.]